MTKFADRSLTRSTTMDDDLLPSMDEDETERADFEAWLEARDFGTLTPKRSQASEAAEIKHDSAAQPASAPAAALQATKPKMVVEGCLGCFALKGVSKLAPQ